MNVGSVIFILIFFGVIGIYPIIGKRLDKKILLSGVTTEVSLPKMNLANLWNGSFQHDLNTYYENYFNGRNLLIKIRGQLLYSLFHESPNSNSIVGKNSNIFGTEYVSQYLPLISPQDTTFYENLIEKLEQLQDLLNEYQKELYIFITPSKAHMLADQLPWRYKILKKDVETDADLLKEALQSSQLNYFDSYDYIIHCNDKVSAPYFYTTGTHWSHSWGQRAAAAFSEYIGQTSSRWDLSEVTVTEKKNKNAIIWPDADIYSSMNLIAEPREQYYESELKITKLRDTPNVFLRGGSFMGQSLSSLVSAGMFGFDTHYENNYYFTDQYSHQVTLDSYTAYDEVDMDTLVGRADIIILEVNEANAGNMCFGFIDYVLEHPEYLDRDF